MWRTTLPIQRIHHLSEELDFAGVEALRYPGTFAENNLEDCPRFLQTPAQRAFDQAQRPNRATRPVNHRRSQPGAGIFYTPRGQIRHESRDSLQAVMSDRKSTRLNSSHRCISYAVFCLKKK